MARAAAQARAKEAFGLGLRVGFVPVTKVRKMNTDIRVAKISLSESVSQAAFFGGGLTEAECQSLIATIQNIHARGTTIVWIEHVIHALLAVVERIIVIDFGRKIAEGDPKTIMESPEVKEIYLGVDPDA